MSALKFLILNILKYVEVYKLWEVCRQNHVLGPICGPRYDHIYKNVHFVKVELRDTPWLKRALKAISNGVLKVQNAWILVDIMRVH